MIRNVKNMATNVATPTTVKLTAAKLIKHGIGRLTATAVPTWSSSATAAPATLASSTRLTQVAHKFPTRLVPIGKSSVDQAGAAVCALSSYGAGMLQGDSSHLMVEVEKGATLGLLTQGATRIYTPRAGQTTAQKVCETKLTATVEKDGVLVYAPDPCSLYAKSCYVQNQEFWIHPESSVVLIDWFSSGRYMNGERWEFDQLCSRTRLQWLDDNHTDDESGASQIPFLQDTIAMDLRRHNDHAVKRFNCFASLILYGEHTWPVLDRCLAISDAIAAHHTRIRSRMENDEVEDINEAFLDGLASYTIGNSTNSSSTKPGRRVVMGVSQLTLPGKPSNASLIRLAATTNEDLYRVFHDALLPMKSKFGMEFYKERIQAQSVEIPKMETDSETISTHPIETPTWNHIDTDSSMQPAALSSSVVNGSQSLDSSESFWSILMLADSGLPTGSFAHSAGLEAAAQLQLIENEQDVQEFAQAATRSTMQLVTPFLVAGRGIAVGTNETTATQISLSDEWDRLHQQCHAVMVTNEPACAASLDQGKSLARVASQWFKQVENLQRNNNQNESRARALIECFASSSNGAPHVAPTLGAIGGVLGLDEIQVCRLFAYCMARDVVSAAVRLSLVGPLASVSLLHKVRNSAEEGIQAVLPLLKDCPGDPMLASAASAPVIEAIQPCHESLQVRLFRS